jgi:hypothetical protein
MSRTSYFAKCSYFGAIGRLSGADHFFSPAQYTNEVVELAVRIVVEDGLPYRSANWHLWRDHRVFVPFATIQNWVEDAMEIAIQNVPKIDGKIYVCPDVSG